MTTKTQIVTQFKNSSCFEFKRNFKIWQKCYKTPKTKIGAKLKMSNGDKTQQLNLCQDSKTEI